MKPDRPVVVGAGRLDHPTGRTAAFEAVFEHRPTGVWAAPGRGNLIGEFTDYNGGSVLPFALDRTTRVAASLRHDRRIIVSSGGAPGVVVDRPVDELRPRGGPARAGGDGDGSGWADYVLGVVWAMRSAGLPVGGAELRIDSDVPVGAGLSSSAALECSVALALDDLHGTGCSPMDLARLAQRAENDFVGVPCGIMDQAASMCCTPGHVLLLDTDQRLLDTDVRRSRQVPCLPSAVGLRLLLIDTRVRHDLADSAYAERRATCQRAAARLGVGGLCDLAADDLDRALVELPDDVTRRRVRHVVTEDARVLAAADLLDAGDLLGVGPLLTTTHRSLRDDFEVSCAELDTAVGAALEVGAHGARMIGGGFGGCVLVLTDTDTVSATEVAVTAAFARAGFAAPVMFGTEPSAGATRLL